MEAYDRRGTERTWRIVEAAQQVAENRGISMAAVAVAWVDGRPAVVSTIVGARTTEQLETSLRVTTGAEPVQAGSRPVPVPT